MLLAAATLFAHQVAASSPSTGTAPALFPLIEASGVEPSLVMRPPAGSALLWRGHLTHAGLPVTSGERHVFVASFDLRVPGVKYFR